MNFKRVGNKPDKFFVVVKNIEASAKIPTGTTAILALNGVDDGAGILLPSNSSAAAQATNMIGVVAGDLAPGQDGQAQTWGICQSVKVLRATRTLPTDPWPSAPAVTAPGLELTMDHTNNCYAVGAAATGPVAVMLAQQIPAYAGGPAAPGDTSLVLTVMVKAFLRFM